MSQDKLRVAVVMGGISSEHEVSINSGRNVSNTLPRERFEVKPVVITLEGRWLLYPGRLAEGEEFSGMPGGVEPVDAGEALSHLVREKVDCVFIALHGPGGEDGTLQGFFETAGIPYTGSGVLGNAVGMDKIIAKQVMFQVGIPTAPFVSAGSEELQRDLHGFIRAVEEKLGYPCVAKVANQGSSQNLGIAGDRSELESWLRKIADAGDYALVEEYLRGQELTCAVIEKPGGSGPLALPPTELVPLTSSFFDYHAKYTPGATDEITPARISPEVTARVQDLALRTHRALRCGGMTRTDMIRRGDDLFVLEINTIPGMTDTSLVPQAAAVAGISFSELLEMQVLWAIEKRGRR
jgi:D-alanine-D-alanine ligase